MTDAVKGTVLKLLSEIGAACAAYQDKHLRGSFYGIYIYDFLPARWKPPPGGDPGRVLIYAHHRLF